MVLVLVACDSGSSSSSDGTSDLTPTTAPDGGGGTGAQAKVDLKEWAVVPDPPELTAGKQAFTVTNSGSTSHDLVILDSTGAEVGRTPVFTSADGPKTLDADLKAGTYKFVCDLPGHEARGMKIDVTVK